jgi:hypothetical protein
VRRTGLVLGCTRRGAGVLHLVGFNLAKDMEQGRYKLYDNVNNNRTPKWRT